MLSRVPWVFWFMTREWVVCCSWTSSVWGGERSLPCIVWSTGLQACAGPDGWCEAVRLTGEGSVVFDAGGGACRVELV